MIMKTYKFNIHKMDTHELVGQCLAHGKNEHEAFESASTDPMLYKLKQYLVSTGQTVELDIK